MSNAQKCRFLITLLTQANVPVVINWDRIPAADEDTAATRIAIIARTLGVEDDETYRLLFGRNTMSAIVRISTWVRETGTQGWLLSIIDEMTSNGMKAAA